MDGLPEVLDQQALETILTSFTELTGLRPALVDLEGKIQVMPPGPPMPRFCQLIKSAPGGTEKCQASYARAGHYAAEFGVPYVFRCHAGLLGWAAPLVVRRTHVATIICSQVLLWEPDEFLWVELAEMTRSLGVCQESLRQAAHELPIVSSRRAQAGADLLFAVGNYVARSGLALLEQRRHITRQQARINEEIRCRKRLQTLIRGKGSPAPLVRIYNNEYALVERIKQGDRIGAHKVLEQVLGDLLTEYGTGSLGFITRLQEICILMVRAAAEAGGSIPRLLNLSQRFLDSLRRVRTVEEGSLQATRALETVLNERLTNPPGSSTWVIQRAADFMRENCHRRLTLTQIADAAYVSKYHLCHLFKRELGCTVFDYLSKLRLEIAKGMLRDGPYPLKQVARTAGFSDLSHFCRLFKRQEGVTPGQFRRLNSQ